MRVKIAVGEQYKFTDCLRQLQETYKERVEWRQNVLNMASYMADCDVALGAPGITTWERACVGLPAAYLAVSDNQRDILAKLEKRKLCLNLGSAASIQDQEFIEKFLQFMNDQKKRKQFYETSIRSVDGLGVNRVVYQLLRLEKGEEIDGFEFHDI
jgi:spore coat polysaccharide biosynthesis predicted glycosyltransferase SpsG